MTLTHELFKKEDLPEHLIASFLKLGSAYESDIGGIDLGFQGFLYPYGNHILLSTDENDELIGFVTGTDLGIDKVFEDEKIFYVSSAYLLPSYRNSSEEHQGVINQALGALVDSLEQQQFDKLTVFPPDMFRSQIVTQIGMMKVLKPLDDILRTRESENGLRVGDQYGLAYIFNQPDYLSKVPKELLEQSRTQSH